MNRLYPFISATMLACSASPAPRTEPANGDRASPPSAIAATTSSPVAAAPVVDLAGATNDAKTPEQAGCELRARDVKGAEGSKRFVLCPGSCLSQYHAVWGSDVYSDDSHVCAAAIHAGAIPPSGGKALFDFLPGQASYAASRRAGVQSRSWGTWSRSFRVWAVQADGTPSKATPPPEDSPGEMVGDVACGVRGSDLLASKDEARIQCPAGCAPGSIYGSGPYTDDSVVCTAARHAGVVADKGGPVVVRRAPRQGGFVGSTRGSITTASWSSEHGAFSVHRP